MTDSNYLDAEELARHVGHASASAMAHVMGRLPPPDTVLNRKPYWSRETAQELIEMQCRAIRAAWGYHEEPRQ